jgi:hypothetical protein
MTKTLGFVFAFFVLAVVVAFSIEPARAQKSSEKCTAAWTDKCIKTCNSRGGQTRLCPTYCRNQQQQAGCR